MNLSLTKILTTLFLSSFITVLSFELPQSSQHYQPGRERTRIGSEVGFHLMEKTYETNTKELEEFKYQHLSGILSIDYGLSPEHVLNLKVHTNFNGRLKKVYDDDSPLGKVHTSYDGLEKIDLSFRSRFTNYLQDGIDQSVVMKIQSGLIAAKDGNASTGQTDFIASYLFSFYLPSQYELYGDLEVGYIGKKRKRRIDGETEVSDTYARTSIDLGLIKRFSHFFTSLDAGFGLTTNYNIKSPSYNITTDKGFFVRAKLAIGYETKRYLLEAFYITRSDVFNKVLPGDQVLDPSLDYEWESGYSALRYAWLF
jgi:hypothetical protein